MTRGSLVRIHHVGPINGTDPFGQVLETVGKVGVVDREQDGWIVVVVPGCDSRGEPFGKLIYKAKELERVAVECPQGWGVAG